LSISSEAIQVIDDAGQVVDIQVPAKRIITLAPYLTELVYSAGAGKQLIATVSFSDFPQTATTLPVVGDANGIDIESVMAMKPDLVLSWLSGNGTAITSKLANLGIRVFQSEPQSIDDISSTILRIGKLAGTEQTAANNNAKFKDAIDTLQRKYSRLKRVPVFYQFWDKPIYTIGATHLISRQIELCGGVNIFADQDVLTLNVNIESILNKDPAVIIASGETHARPQWLEQWNDWKSITAVRNNNLYSIPPELIQRHSVRITQGMELICRYINSARD
jgi:iron complex transport system substrate-binding protein